MDFPLPPGGFIDSQWSSIVPPPPSIITPGITPSHPSHYHPYQYMYPALSRKPISIKAPLPRSGTPPSTIPFARIDNPYPINGNGNYNHNHNHWVSNAHANPSPNWSSGASEVRSNISSLWTRPSNLTSPSTATSTGSSSRHSSSSSLSLLNTTTSNGPSSRVDEQGKNVLDRFATSYTPLWLQNLPPAEHVIPIIPLQPFPPFDYTTTVFPLHLQDSLPLSEIYPSILTSPPPDLNSRPRPLDADKALSHPKYYAQHFSHLLALYLLAQTEDMTKALVHQVPLHLDLASEVNNTGVETFKIHIPGIREDSPRLNIGDKLMLRGLYINHQAPSKTEVEAQVTGLQKGQGMVFVTSPALKQLDVTLPKEGHGDKKAAMYQIKFATSAAPVCAMQDSIRTFALLLHLQWSIARRWLFPLIDDASNVLRAGPQKSDISWKDEELNDEQRAAVFDIVSNTCRIPYLISGPPGTGKTKLLVEAVLQTLASHPDAAIIVCAPSNPAADTVARRLVKHLKPADMFRLNSPIRTFAEVPEQLLPFCHINSETNQFGIPSYQDLMKFKVVVTTCLDANILVDARASNAVMMRAESELHSALHPSSSKRRPVFPHWTHLFVDEAAQASEPETLIPLSVVVCPLPEGYESEEPLVVLCGDIHQLGPIIPSAQARAGELDVSLLERLFQRDVYAAHPAARRHLRRSSTSHWPYPPPFANLVRNYRSAPPILMIPATMFYEDTLIPAAPAVNKMQWKELPNPEIPILFRGCEEKEDWIEEGASWFNAGEVKTVVDLIKSLRKDRPDIKQSEIAVITPWREQVWRLRAALREADLRQVNVGNVETYQGAEFRVTIISCVRSRSRFLVKDHEANMGLYHQRKRFNVAITRAKELLVVVGNANLLKGDPYWNGFLQIMLRNNLYAGPKVELEMTGAYVSRLESAMHINDQANDDQAVLLLAGAMAREALIEE